MSMDRRVITLLSRFDLNDKEILELKELMNTHANWANIYGMLFHHRLFGIAYSTLTKYFTYAELKEFACPTFYSNLRNNYMMQLSKNKEHLKQTLNVCEVLLDQDIKFILLKGLTLALNVYQDIGCRHFNDTDILVHPKQLEEAISVIKDLGYTQGGFDFVKQEVIPATRRELITRPLFSHEVVPLRKKIDDNPFFDAHVIDLQFSIDLMTGNRTDELVEEVMETSIRLDIEQCHVPSLNWDDSLLYVCMHYYKEATSDFNVYLYKDLGIYKLCDIYHMFKSPKITINWDRFMAQVKRLNLQKEVYYAFSYMHALYGHVLPDSIISELKPDNLEYLNEVYKINSDKKLAITWESEIADRIFDMDRVSLLLKSTV
ncbi:nucleotidyltransferase family protein [Paenibacillus periandrae]|uniref:nucleotidyltransferase domain-containing protein n=1 Tax=Paenibacillus periandrae TaxID=1761741 RepID=UPI001F08E374|nr:nucleotidyltransferase family protein [Paenibacillus periandrae]